MNLSGRCTAGAWIWLACIVCALAINGLVVVPRSSADQRTPAHLLPLSGRPTSDYNNDGYADLAVSSSRLISEDTGEGLVHVMYGSATGLTNRGARTWSGSDFKFPIDAEFPDELGAALATGDFDGDHYADLAVGDTARRGNSGAAVILYGSPTGLTTSRSRVFTLLHPGTVGDTGGWGRLGPCARGGQFWQGCPRRPGHRSAWENLRRRGTRQRHRCRSVGSSTGLSTTGSQIWSQASRGIIGKAEQGDHLGESLAAGTFSESGFADLAIGVPGDSVGRSWFVGAVNILRGSASGLTVKNSQRWSQASPGIKGKAQYRDNFGASLAVGRFSGHRTMDLAVGVPWESVHGNEEAGAVNIIRGSSTGLTSRGNQILTQDSRGVPGRADSEDSFGTALAAATFGHRDRGRNATDLAVGSPGESVRAAENAGSVTVIYSDGAGLKSDGSQSFSQNTPGIHGDSRDDDSFGAALTAGDYGREPIGLDDLVVGVPGEDPDSSIHRRGRCDVRSTRRFDSDR